MAIEEKPKSQPSTKIGDSAPQKQPSPANEALEGEIWIKNDTNRDVAAKPTISELKPPEK